MIHHEGVIGAELVKNHNCSRGGRGPVLDALENGFLSLVCIYKASLFRWVARLVRFRQGRTNRNYEG